MASRGKKTMLGPTSRHPRPSPTKKVTTAIFRKVFLIGRGVGRGRGENLGGAGFFKKKKINPQKISNDGHLAQLNTSLNKSTAHKIPAIPTHSHNHMLTSNRPLLHNLPHQRHSKPSDR